ncbi:DUF3179 domain-containing protein [Candidatus Woesearchaeota archaeon]|nr:DUF3179 domain-containing protein [Candidatus Woesearchaeota archaeon]
MKNNKYVLGAIISLVVIAIFIIQDPFSDKEIVMEELQDSKDTGLEIGNLAPDFILSDINGGEVQLSNLRGKLVIINFWASWCPPCREEFPEFEKIFQENKDIEVLGINLQEDKEKIDFFLEEIPVTFTLLLDPSSDVKEMYNVFTQPVTYFIDKNGRITDKKFGPLTEKEIEEKFGKLKESSEKDKIKVLEDGTKYIIHPSKILSGGPPKDGIPSLDVPKFIPAHEADTQVDDDDLVLGLFYDGVAKAYPHKILNWHEIVNDKINGERILITYCPLCRTGIAFKPIVNGQEVEFGTSGKLYNSELVMYDRLTDSYWSQTPGKAIIGSATGQVLEKVPLDTVRWKDWRKAHPDTQVLRKETGFIRDYSRNPYEGYENSERLYFPVESSDDRLHAKKIVFGVEFNGKSKAYEESDVQRDELINDVIGDVPIVVLWDDVLNTVKIFERTFEGEALEFRIENDKILDNKKGEWDVNEMSSKLEVVDTFGHFWFSWVSFYPETELYA